MKTQHLILLTLCILLIVPQGQAGLFSGGICSAGCAAVVCACYSAAGATFGTVVASATTPAKIRACDAAFGRCMSSCSVATSN